MDEHFDRRHDPDYARMVIQRCREGDVSLIHTVDFYTEDGVDPEDVGSSLEEIMRYDRRRVLRELHEIVVRYRIGKADPAYRELGTELLSLCHEGVTAREFGSSRKEVAEILLVEASGILCNLRAGRNMRSAGEELENYLRNRTGFFRRVTPERLGMTALDHAFLRAAAFTRALEQLHGYRSKRLGPATLLSFFREIRNYKFTTEEFGITRQELRDMRRELRIMTCCY